MKRKKESFKGKIKRLFSIFFGDTSLNEHFIFLDNFSNTSYLYYCGILIPKKLNLKSTSLKSEVYSNKVLKILSSYTNIEEQLKGVSDEVVGLLTLNIFGTHAFVTTVGKKVVTITNILFIDVEEKL